MIYAMEAQRNEFEGREVEAKMDLSPAVRASMIPEMRIQWLFIWGCVNLQPRDYSG